MSLLGIVMAFVFNGFLINLVKIWLGRPRPDFLARCIPREGTPLYELVTSEVCTNENISMINEGFKSTPSGHASTSFAGLGFLSLWLAGQLAVLRPRTELYKCLVAIR
jgi:diacylglycerol diphosphate phosphatase/phosphatidate phosphatase